MSARDELQKVIFGYFGPTFAINAYKTPETQDRELADAILAAGSRRPRTITTAEELDALPLYGIVTRNGVPYTKTARGWQLAGVLHVYTAASLLLNDNATVLYEPGQP